MNKIGRRVNFPCCLIAILIFIQFSCKNEFQSVATPTAKTDLDIKTIENITGIPFNILKTKSLGYGTLHEFYWISLPGDVDNKKVENLAEAVIEELISKKKSSYSITFHFFREDGLIEKRDKLKYFARVHFLPEGNWQKVGRIPIDNYEQYKLIISFIKD